MSSNSEITQEVLIVSSIHGIEPIGHRVYSHIIGHDPELLDSVDMIIGNPIAMRDSVRFVETDLNRSFVDSELTYEQRRALTILRYIERTRPTVVLDMHNTTIDMDPAFIAYSLSDPVKKFMAACTVENVVVMPDKIAYRSLIGNVPNAVSIEVSDSDMEQTDIIEQLAMGIRNFVDRRKIYNFKRQFKVSEMKTVGDLEGMDISTLKNFKMNEELGFVPILAGKPEDHNQEEYVCFTATAEEKLVIA